VIEKKKGERRLVAKILCVLTLNESRVKVEEENMGQNCPIRSRVAGGKGKKGFPPCPRILPSQSKRMKKKEGKRRFGNPVPHTTSLAEEGEVNRS